MKEAAVATQENVNVMTPAAPAPERESVLQRRCACGGAAAGIVGVCKECDGKRLTVQRYSMGRPRLFNTPSLTVAGPLSKSLENAAGGRAGLTRHNFGHIPVHTVLKREEEHAAIDAIDLDESDHAEPISVSPSSEPAQLAATQTHASQGNQDHSTRETHAASEQTESLTVGTDQDPLSAEATSTALILEDDAPEMESGQMRKSDFLDQLEGAVRAMADAELRAVGRTAESCPYIESWIGYYRTRGSKHVERAILRYAPEAARAATARDYVSLVSERVRRAVAVWSRSGQITEVPQEVRSLLQGMGLDAVEGVLSAAESAISSSAIGGTSRIERESSRTGNLFSRGREGNSGPNSDPRTIQSQLDSGSPLDNRVRAQMETAFDYNFSRVRVHADSRAGALSSNLGARAFTVGSDIAFGSGEYQPGTLMGDALIAHELAHVVQQSKEGPHAEPMPMEAGHGALEEDADQAAIGAVAGIWGGAKGKLIKLGEKVSPRMKSGLRLSRCKTECPTKIELASLHPIKLQDSDFFDKGWRTGVGAVAEMLVTDPKGRDWNGKEIRENLTPGENTCGPGVSNCKNEYGRAGPNASPFSGGSGSLFKVGDAFSDKTFGLNLPGKKNTFYDAHFFALRHTSVLHSAGLASCEQWCDQSFECPGAVGPIGNTTFYINRSFSRGQIQGTDVTNVRVLKGGVTFSGGSADWSEVLKR